MGRLLGEWGRVGQGGGVMGVVGVVLASQLRPGATFPNLGNLVITLIFSITHSTII